MLRHRAAALVVGLLVAAVSCVRPAPRLTTTPGEAAAIAQLWQAPADIGRRNLYDGPGGRDLQPDPSARYEFIAADRSGYSEGYNVRGPDGVQWAVKLGPEAQTEVVSSRVLWAIGYHQPPTYFLSRWTLAGGEEAGVKGAGRFRPDLADRKVVGDWSWYENAFVGTKPFQGLIVANLILNNWDWKTSNNKIYEQREAGRLRRLFVVRDLGASLGKTKFPPLLKWFPVRGLRQGSRNDLEGFEEQGFVKKIEEDRITFDYDGIHEPLVDTLSPADVVWACRLLAQISDRQWDGAFRAAGYELSVRTRYVAKIKSKISEGLRLGRTGQV